MVLRPKKNKFLRKFIFFALLIIILSGAYFYNRYYYFLYQPIDLPENAIQYSLSIQKGDTASKISQKLAKDGLIADKLTFDIYTRLAQTDKKIRTGIFSLNTNMNTIDIVNTLISGEQKQISITIPEGYTLNQIDSLLSDQNLIKRNELITSAKNFKSFEKFPFLNQDTQKKLINPLEGYLFPDTYFIDPTTFTAENFLKSLLSNFEKKAFKIIKEANAPLEETINIASMIEKESGQDSDRPLIADIIKRRLKLNWPLGIDATSLYLKSNRDITQSDLLENSPYNTRKNLGLPPGPIANPGLKSIKAALNPESNEYLFYLHTKKGETIFSKTNEEHNLNKQKYLR